MTDLKQMLEDVREMRHLFAECYKHAPDDSEEKVRYNRWVLTLAELSMHIAEIVEEGDDGK